MKPLKALSKQLFGAHYERVLYSLLSCLIIFVALYAVDIRIMVAPQVLFLTSTLFSAGVMWRAVSSKRNTDIFMGLFMLPFDNRGMIVSYVLAFGSYTLITKTSLVLTPFFAVARWSVIQVLLAFFFACMGCMLAAAGYYMISRKKPFPINAYYFYRPASARKLTKHNMRSGSVMLYFLRYLFTDINYLTNTAGLWLVACFLPFLLGEFQGLNVMPFGFAVLCLNTPICILLSCDPGLEQAVRALPEQAIRFCRPYCLFIALVNMAGNGIYLIVWQHRNGGIGDMEVLTAALFALQSAILSVLLEWLRPLRNWKIESDLWHHPRKYIVPLLMMLAAALVGAWPFTVWIWLCIMVAECICLLYMA